jgi:hypothetical protein
MSVQRTGRRRVLALTASMVVALGLAAGGWSVASADEGSPSGGPPRPALTDIQASCLESHGVTRPAKPADGTKPTPPTDAQRAAAQAAAQACGVSLPAGGPHLGRPGGPGGPGGNRSQLTDAQASCLESHGVTRPTKPADGTRPTPPTEAQRAALQAAAQACGIILPKLPGTTT